ncbi:LytTR family DNA-binding domain-containing protein [Ruminococcus sp.]|uniref:LytTR family DNA-binding domain-containing protein n=1 Tax=Ruminococcus sp. TaxID=41978 RepID=UPI003862F0BC
MQVEIKIDDNCIEPKVIIITDKVNDEINDILNTLSSKTPEVITGFYNKLAEILSPEDIIRIYAESGKTFASVDKKEYILKQRLYELEEQLSKHSFVRISNSEIINLKKVRNFDLSLSGTICVTLSDNTTTYVSRRYVSKIKQVLGL